MSCGKVKLTKPFFPAISERLINSGVNVNRCQESSQRQKLSGLTCGGNLACHVIKVKLINVSAIFPRRHFNQSYELCSQKFNTQ